MNIVFVGLSLSSSWGNGHATTFRALMRGLDKLGHRLAFLERDVPWYANNRDLAEPDFCTLHYYESVPDLVDRFGDLLAAADAVIVGSFVPQGVAVIDAIVPLCTGSFCFYDIDTPVTLAKLRALDFEYLADHQIPLFDIYFSFTGGPTLERLETEFCARRAEALYCSVDESRYAPQAEEKIWDLGYLGTYSVDRQPTLERLLIEVARRMPDRRFVVAGPQYPTDMELPANVDRIEHLPPTEHASFYSRQRFTLNVTRADMIAAGWSPSVRLFEAAACGCPVISDRWPGLEDLFPFGRAIEVADTTEDVCAILARDDAEAIAEQARKIVLASHTGEARARELVAALQSLHVTKTHQRDAIAMGASNA
ncbi:glycosyl transferase [Nitratireductor aestuarii]|uniref:Glycosyl transferase n=1 Tax=Nitratireductor aestuarii TaxID=1735103 RepID=A0A916RXD6_9HYPH|nr:glycosyltransferase [Nitratireductor aestuarii]GGA74909.1 glycosyl transferase [Nitratireductor aestuarii]